MSVEQAVLAAYEHDRDINLHRFPIRVEFDITKAALILEGEAENIIAKKRAFVIASEMEQVHGVIDRLHLAPSERRGDGAIRDSIEEALLQESALRTSAIRIAVGNRDAMETKREASGSPEGLIEVVLHKGIVELTGQLISLSHKRLVGVLMWWVPGSRDVINGIQVVPPQRDNDDEISDALHLVLEKDPLVHTDRIGIRVKDRAVTLAGRVATKEEKKMAEFNAWYLVGVNKVINTITVVL